MGPAARTGLIVLWHALVLATVAGQTERFLVEREWREAREEPLYRTYVHFDVGDPERPQSSFESDLLKLRDRPAPTVDVLRLMAHLRGLESGGKAQYEAAAKDCVALGWPKCDKQTLTAMRRLLFR